MRIRLRGKDSLSSYTITRNTCGVCRKNNQLVIAYDRRTTTDPKTSLVEARVYQMLTWVDILKYTILGKAFDHHRNGYVGIQCGCYAKLHRQVVHVSTGVSKKMHVMGVS